MCFVFNRPTWQTPFAQTPLWQSISWLQVQLVGQSFPAVRQLGPPQSMHVSPLFSLPSLHDWACRQLSTICVNDLNSICKLDLSNLCTKFRGWRGWGGFQRCTPGRRHLHRPLSGSHRLGRRCSFWGTTSQRCDNWVRHSPCTFRHYSAFHRYMTGPADSAAQ